MAAPASHAGADGGHREHHAGAVPGGGARLDGCWRAGRPGAGQHHCEGCAIAASCVRAGACDAAFARIRNRGPSSPACLPLQLPKARPAVFVHVRSDTVATSVSSSVLEMCALAGAESITVVRDEKAVPPGCALEIVSDAVSVYLNLKGSVDTKAEIGKLEKQRTQLFASVATIEKAMANADYETKVPEKVRTANAEKLVKLRTEIAAADKGIADFELLA